MLRRTMSGKNALSKVSYNLLLRTKEMPLIFSIQRSSIRTLILPQWARIRDLFWTLQGRMVTLYTVTVFLTLH